MPTKPDRWALVNNKTLTIEHTGSLVLMRKLKGKMDVPKDYKLWNIKNRDDKFGDSVQTISPETLKKYVKNMRKEVATDPEI
jgi:hypothetical protein